MRKQIARITGTVGVMLLAACATGGANQFSGNSFAPDSDRETPRRVANGTVIEGEEIREQGDLLSAMRHRVRNMQVQYGAGCPAVVLRGQKTMTTPSNAKIYVDGQQAVDTCILSSIQPIDVDHIEIYPMGVSPRPGYLSHPHGLILVFTRTA